MSTTGLSKTGPRPPGRKRQIIEAALGCFAAAGFSQTTLEEIRAVSGASTGSIYHHFRNKEQLAAAVYLEGIVDYQKGFLAELEGCDEARTGVLAMISFHVRWVAENPEWARYLFQMRRAEFVAATEPLIKTQNQRFFASVSRWLEARIAAGELVEMPRDIYHALLLGPCQDYVCRWLAGRTNIDTEQAAEQIGEAVWRCLAPGSAGAERDVKKTNGPAKKRTASRRAPRRERAAQAARKQPQK